MRKLSISAQCSDRFSCRVYDDGKEVLSYDGYIPNFIPNRYGDNLTLEIDAETGTILNWKENAITLIQEFINSKKEEKDEEEE